MKIPNFTNTFFNQPAGKRSHTQSAANRIMCTRHASPPINHSVRSFYFPHILSYAPILRVPFIELIALLVDVIAISSVSKRCTQVYSKPVLPQFRPVFAIDYNTTRLKILSFVFRSSRLVDGRPCPRCRVLYRLTRRAGSYSVAYSVVNLECLSDFTLPSFLPV
jgi:hypothetical protein